METVDQILSYAREHNGETTPPWACFMEDGGVDISALLDRLEAAIKREREAVGEVVREIGGCCVVRVNCCNCGKGEEVFFVPKNLITKLESAITQAKGN